VSTPTPADAVWPVSTRQAARIEESLAGTQLSLIDVRFTVPWECSKRDLDAAATALVRRHAALRSRFVPVAGGWEVHIDPALDMVVTLFESEFVRPAGLENRELHTLEPPLAWFFAAERSGRFEFVMLLEHCVSDGDSVETLVRDFLTLVAESLRPGEASLGPVLGRPYGDFVLQESEILASSKLQVARDAWVKMFDGTPVTRGVPAEYWSPTLAGELCAVRGVLSAAELAALRAACARYRTTTAAVFLAAVASAFMDQFATTEFVCTVPVNARTKQDRDTVGYYINLMPLRVSWPVGTPPADRVDQARKALVNLLMYRAVPGVRILEDPRLAVAGQADAPVVLIQGAETTAVEVLAHRVAVDDGHGTREELGLTVRIVEGTAPSAVVDYDPGRFGRDVPEAVLRQVKGWIARLGEVEL